MDYETKRPLMEAIDKCLLDHVVAMGTKEGGPDILDVYRLQGLSEIHYYLKVQHDFQADEVAALLQFTDPLTVAMECWEERDPVKGFPICNLFHEIRQPVIHITTQCRLLRNPFHSSISKSDCYYLLECI